MRRGPFLVLSGIAAIVLVVIILALVSGGGESDKPDDALGEIDLAAIPTATLPPVTPEAIFLNDVVTVTATATRPGGGPDQEYVVQPGDTPASIAPQFGITSQELLDYNDIDDPTTLQVGQVLKIPAPAPTETPEEDGTPTPRGGGTGTPEAGVIEYVVVAGDTASEIASRFGITLEELAEANDMGVEELKNLDVGQMLKIPTD